MKMVSSVGPMFHPNVSFGTVWIVAKLTEHLTSGRKVLLCSIMHVVSESNGYGSLSTLRPIPAVLSIIHINRACW
jgi:hypothetical protein